LASVRKDFFLKKRSKKLLQTWSRVLATGGPERSKVFWFFFSKKNILAFTGVVALAGCADQACKIPGTRPMALVTLYFGRDIAGHGMVTDAQWARFAADVIGPAFPDGFTVFDAHGQWRNPATGAVGDEATKVVEIAAPASVDVRAGIAAVADAYRQQYHQIAVGVVSSKVCAAF
jgi:hypothetical protein